MSQTAPGKSYRKGISLIELFQMFPDEKTAEEWFEKKRWGQVGKPTHCPLCGCSERVKPVLSRNPLPYRCAECRRYFSVKTRTVMHRSHIPYQKWLIGIYLWATSLKGVSSMRLHRDLNITQRSAWFMAQRLREAWNEGIPEMAGTFEVDETFMGGKEKNKHKDKKLNAGRGAVGKVAVAGIKNRETNTINAVVVARTDKETLQGFVSDRVDTEATVFSDDFKSYHGLPYEHKTVKHSVGQYVNGQAHTNGIESFWSLLKKGYHGTFHHFSPKHMNRYITEFATRYNVRPMNTIDIMGKSVKMMVGKRLTYQELALGETGYGSNVTTD